MKKGAKKGHGGEFGAGMAKHKKNFFAVAKKRSPFAVWFQVLAGCLWLIAIVLGSFALAGCTSTSKAVKSLYLAEYHTNATYDIQFQVGYFGGCITVNHTAGGATVSSNSSSGDSQSHCVSNLHNGDPDDLSEEFWEDLRLTEDALNNLKSTLNQTIPKARHLQNDVFPWSVPVAHLVLFTLSGVMLFVAVTNPTNKRGYKAMLSIAVLASGFALALAFVATLGSLQALNGLLDGDKSQEERSIDSNFYIQRAGALGILQAAQLSFVTLFYALIALMFVGAAPRGKSGHGGGSYGLLQQSRPSSHPASAGNYR